MDLPANLVSLCAACHLLRGDDPGFLGVFLSIVAERERFESGEVVQDYLWLVLRTPKGQPLPVAPVCPY